MIERAGFVDVHEASTKWPIGPWPKQPQFKEIGYWNSQHWKTGMEGWAMWLLSKFGAPYPWRREEVQVYTAKIRNELNDPRYHVWHKV